MASRIKAASISDRAEFERCVDELARHTVALRQLEAVRDERIQEVRAEWEPACTQTEARIKALAVMAEKYAEANRGELLPGKGKSAETPLAIYGFRLGQKTLKLLNKSWSWEKVVEALGAASRFVRTKCEADKDALKLHLNDVELAKVGLRVDQAEAFFIEPKEKAPEEKAVA